MRRALQLLLIASAACVAVAPLPRDVVERVYSRGVYPVIQPRLTGFSNRLDVALFDVTLLVVAIALLLIWVARIRGMRRGSRLRNMTGLVVDTATIGALVYVWFLLAWGLNYQREPLQGQLDFREDRITTDRLRELARRDVDTLNRLHGPAHRVGWPELREMGSTLSDPFDHVQRDLAMSWRAAAGRPKRSLLDVYFKRVAVDGMTDPFFLETLTNQDLLPFERPFVVAHEWGHLAGYGDESEANFLAWLICLRGAEPDQYSAWISLYGTIVTSLPPGDRSDLEERLQPEVRADLRAIAERIASQVNPAASRAGYAAYDRFLKANRVEAGVRSYSEVVRLLLGVAFNSDGGPVLARVQGP